MLYATETENKPWPDQPLSLNAYTCTFTLVVSIVLSVGYMHMDRPCFLRSTVLTEATLLYLAVYIPSLFSLRSVLSCYSGEG